MRCFIAADVNSSVRANIATFQDQLRAQMPCQHADLKWVHPDLIHITLKFLGEVPDRDVVAICRAAEATAAEHDPFELDIQGVGHRGHCARTLWARATRGIDDLTDLHANLEAHLDDIGWPPDIRRFSAHLTLCRTKSPRAGFDLARACGPWQDQAFGTTEVDTLVVYHSQLTPQGPIYTPMGKYPLGETKDS